MQTLSVKYLMISKYWLKKSFQEEEFHECNYFPICDKEKQWTEGSYL